NRSKFPAYQQAGEFKVSGLPCCRGVGFSQIRHSLIVERFYSSMMRQTWVLKRETESRVQKVVLSPWFLKAAACLFGRQGQHNSFGMDVKQVTTLFFLNFISNTNLNS